MAGMINVNGIESIHFETITLDEDADNSLSHYIVSTSKLL